MPANTVVVTRPSTFGNPFKVGNHYKRGDLEGVPKLGLRFTWTEAFEGYQTPDFTTIQSAAEAVEWYRWYLSTKTPAELAEFLAPLRGQHLACWCKLTDKDGGACRVMRTFF